MRTGGRLPIGNSGSGLKRILDHPSPPDSCLGRNPSSRWGELGFRPKQESGRLGWSRFLFRPEVPEFSIGSLPPVRTEERTSAPHTSRLRAELKTAFGAELQKKLQNKNSSFPPKKQIKHLAMQGCTVQTPKPGAHKTGTAPAQVRRTTWSAAAAASARAGRAAAA